MKIFDFCIFNNEYDILELRLEYMSDFVERFYVAEINLTHQSSPSEFYSYKFIPTSSIAQKLIDEGRLIFVRIELEPSNEYFAIEKRHRIEFSNWVKNNVKEEFIGLLSDCDEIISKDILFHLDDIHSIKRLDLKMFYFSADNYSHLHSWNYFVKIFNSKNLEEIDFQSMREYSTNDVIYDMGWHFSCFGGINQVIDKIKSYSHSEFNNSSHAKKEILIERLRSKKDYLGRPEYPCIRYNVDNFPNDLKKILEKNKSLLYMEELLKKETKRTYITHATEKYLPVAHNLAKSIRSFSDTPVVVYCIDVDKKDTYIFQDIENVYTEILTLNIDKPDNFPTSPSGNFYVDRWDSRSFNVLSAKVLAMKHALESGWEEVCYLDSDCIATPIVDELFEWTSNITNFPIGTKGIHDYMIIFESGSYMGNPFEGCYPAMDYKQTLEWPLMQFMGMPPEDRGIYRTTGIMLMNQNCLNFINIWWDLCQILPKITNIKKIAPFQEETVYNVLYWKWGNSGFPLCYVNVDNGLSTVEDFYTIERQSSYLVNYDEGDFTKHFYKIPEDKRDVKVLHGEKTTSEMNKIVYYLKQLDYNGYFQRN